MRYSGLDACIGICMGFTWVLDWFRGVYMWCSLISRGYSSSRGVRFVWRGLEDIFRCLEVFT